MQHFRAADDARDLDAAVAVMSGDVVLHSPIVFAPYAGKAATRTLLGAVATVFEDFAYQAELASEDGSRHALLFRARVDDRELEGCDFLHHGPDGLVDELTVMVRPLSAALALRDRMAALVGAGGTP